MNKVSRAEKMLEKLAIRTGMSESGMQWLKCAIDPFHDGALTVEGFPDMTQGASIVQCVKQTATVTIASVASDVVIRTDNFMFRNVMTSALQFDGSSQSFLNGAPSVQQQVSGGLQITTVNSGLDPSVSSSTGFATTALHLGGTFQRRRFRFLSHGFEVHNVTPELYKGGSVTTFTQEQSEKSFSSLVLSTGGVPITIADFVPVQPCPQSEANVLLLPGSRTWDASAGCYVVAPMIGLDNPPTCVSNIQPIIARSSNTGVYLDDLSPLFPVYAGQFQIPACTNGLIPGSGGGFVRQNKTIPFNTAGAYFTGLPVGTVLKVNYNIWVERFPSEADGDITVLARPSADFDPVALEAYARIMQIMPVGVPVSENGFGDWFAGGVAAIVDAMTGTPYASLALKAGDAFLSSTNQGDSSPYKQLNREATIVRKPKPLPPIPNKRPTPPPKPNNNNNNNKQNQTRKPLPQIPHKK